MTVLQGVKDLLGKEDVNWGASSSTYSRETQTGSSIDIHYIDDACIPATTLGGYVGTHLHSQNTDSLTTAATFGINSTGNSLVLSSTGLTASRTFTFPNVAQQLIGATDLLSIATGKGAALVGIEDASNYFSGATVEAITQELGSDVAALQASTHNRGMKNGFKLGYSTTTAITVSGGMWAHTGTSNQHVYTNAQVTFTLGSGGSNSGSTDLGASQVHYIYIDDSAVVAAGTALLTSTEFLNSTTAPSYNHAKAGWYNGTDRCIGAIVTNSSSEIRSFAVFGGQYYRYAAPILEMGSTAAGTTYAALDLSSSVPRFSTRARLRLTCATAGTAFYFDTASTAVTPDACVTSHANLAITVEVSTNSSQNTYWYASATNVTDIGCTGYFIDEL